MPGAGGQNSKNSKVTNIFVLEKLDISSEKKLINHILDPWIWAFF